MDVCFMRNAPPPATVVLGDKELAQQQCVKLLGVFIQQNLKWDKQVNEILRKAYAKLYMLCLLKPYNVPTSDLLTVYNCYIRPTVEYAVPVWNPGLTKDHVRKLENVQKRAFKIILGREFTQYDDALSLLKVCTLAERRKLICLQFAKELNKPTGPCHHLMPQAPETAFSMRLRKRPQVPQIKF